MTYVDKKFVEDFFGDLFIDPADPQRLTLLDVVLVGDDGRRRQTRDNCHHRTKKCKENKNNFVFRDFVYNTGSTFEDHSKTFIGVLYCLVLTEIGTVSQVAKSTGCASINFLYLNAYFRNVSLSEK